MMEAVTSRKKSFMPPYVNRTYSPKRPVNEAVQTVQMHLNQEFVGHVDFPSADGHVHRFVCSSVDYPRVNKETTRSHARCRRQAQPGCGDGQNTFSPEVPYHCYLFRLVTGVRPGACGTNRRCRCFECPFFIAIRLVCRSRYLA